jgi:drug/metabolite transporter (DMT)-like permease
LNQKAINWFILIALTFIWGSSFILMKRGIEVFSGDEVGALRIFIAFLSISPLIFKYINKEMTLHWKAFFAMGLFGNLIPGFLFAFSQFGISSSLTSMINSLTPLFTLIIALLFYREKIRSINALGIFVGLIGTVGLIFTNRGAGSNSNLWFVGLALVATFCNGITANIIKYKLGNVNSVACTVWAMTFVGSIAGVYLFTATDFVTKLHTHPQAWNSVGYIALLGVFGTSLSFVLFNILIKNSTSIFATSVTYLMPIVAVMWGVYDGETILPLHLVCAVVILAGVYLVNVKRKTAT